MANLLTKKGVALPLHANGSTTFGTDHDVAVTVATEFSVAGRHFTILPEGDRYVLEDLKSGMGTLINSEPTTRRLLVHGDRIQAGKLELTFSDPSPAKTTAAATTKLSSNEPANLQLPANKESVPEAQDQKKSILAFAFGRKKKTKLVLPTLPKKKPLPKPLIKREVIRIDVKPDPNVRPITIADRILGKTRKRYQPELKLNGKAEKPEVKASKEQVPPATMACKQTVCDPKPEPKPVEKSKPSEAPQPVVPAVPALPPLAKNKSSEQAVTGVASDPPPVKAKDSPKKSTKRQLPSVSKIARQHSARMSAILLNGAKTVRSSVVLARSAVANMIRALAPLLALPAKMGRATVAVSARAWGGLRSSAAFLTAVTTSASNAVKSSAAKTKQGAQALSAAKEAIVDGSASLLGKLKSARVSMRGYLENQLSKLKPRTPAIATVPAPDAMQKSDDTKRESDNAPVGIFVRPRRAADDPRPGLLDGWWQAIGVGSAIAAITVGIVWDSQNDQMLYGFISQYTQSKQPTLVTSDRNRSEPAVAVSQPRSEYPVTESDHIVGTWVAVETAETGARAGSSQRVQPGAAFRFERWGGLKMLTGSGRKDGQRLSEVEAVGLQVHFQASYEIPKPGLVVFHTEDGDLLFSANRKQDGLALALLDPASNEPVVELLCQPNRKLKR